MVVVKQNIIENFTLSPYKIQDYIPDTDAFNWCVEQQVTHSNNLELQFMLLPLAAFFMLIGYFWSLEYESTEKYAKGFVYMARLFLIVFFFVYILVIRLRIYY